MIDLDHLVPQLLELHPRSVRKATVLAIVYKRTKIISFGFNRRIIEKVVHPCYSVHAEESALRKAGRRAVGATMYIVRVRRDGTYGLARPCNYCSDIINRSGIVKVTYT